MNLDDPIIRAYIDATNAYLAGAGLPPLKLSPQSADADSSAHNIKDSTCEVTATRKPVTGDSVAPASPAISPAVIAKDENNQQSSQQLSKSGNQSGNGNTKANCYECKHRRTLTYSAHSECKHPALDGKGAILAIAAIMAGGRFRPFNLTGSAHGMRNGWFSWPLDFDPIWLKTCDAFEPLTEPAAPQTNSVPALKTGNPASPADAAGHIEENDDHN